jgi:hypothetical protein
MKREKNAIDYSVATLELSSDKTIEEPPISLVYKRQCAGAVLISDVCVNYYCPWKKAALLPPPKEKL